MHVLTPEKIKALIAQQKRLQKSLLQDGSSYNMQRLLEESEEYTEQLAAMLPVD